MIGTSPPERNIMNSTTTTIFGQAILDIINMTQSMKPVIEYIIDSKYFDNCQPTDQYKVGYLYQIPLKTWTTATGIHTDRLPTKYHRNSFPVASDGFIWVDFDFEDDGEGNGYTETEGQRFVYISLYNYNGEFNNDTDLQ